MATNDGRSTPARLGPAELAPQLERFRGELRAGGLRRPAPTMDARTAHLIALVKDGATLTGAGRVYGISGERVRQLLKEGGVSASDLPGRAAKPRTTRSSLEPELAPVVEAMWREGMLDHEVAEVFDLSCEVVHRLIRNRVRSPELDVQMATRVEDGRSSDERRRDGTRRAAQAVAQIATVDATSSPERPSPLTLRAQLVRFKGELQASGLRQSTIHAYLLGSSLFVRWLAGDYVPGRGRTKGAPGRGAEGRS